MSKTESNMVSLGTNAINFELPDVVTGKTIQLEDHQSYKATVLMFICNHCPYVKHINAKLTQLANEYIPQGIRFIAINSNDALQYPDDSRENMCTVAQNQKYPFPYLCDETQEIAKAYHAACTPDFFVYDQQLALVYRGQFDDSRPGNQIPVTGNSLGECLDCLIHEKAVNLQQKPSIGCNIKWKL